MIERKSIIDCDLLSLDEIFLVGKGEGITLQSRKRGILYTVEGVTFLYPS